MSRKTDGQRDVVHLADLSFVSLETNVRGKNKSLEDDFLTSTASLASLSEKRA